MVKKVNLGWTTYETQIEECLALTMSLDYKNREIVFLLLYIILLSGIPRDFIFRDYFVTKQKKKELCGRNGEIRWSDWISSSSTF